MVVLSYGLFDGPVKSSNQSNVNSALAQAFALHSGSPNGFEFIGILDATTRAVIIDKAEFHRRLEGTTGPPRE